MLSRQKSRVLAGLLHVICATTAFAGPQPDSAKPGITLTREAWQKAITEAAPLGPGCFQATYPDTALKQVPCEAPPALPHFSPPKAWEKGSQKIVGNGKGYVLVAPQGKTLSRVAGSFPSIKGVTSVSTFAGEPGERYSYGLQLNARTSTPTSICQGLGEHCYVWQQFVYTTPDYSASGDDAEMGIGYWIFGADSCPSSFRNYGGFCISSSAGMKVPRIPVTDLDKVQLWGFAYPGVYDHMYLVYKDTIYILNNDTSALRLGEAWDWAEFNIFGNGGGGEAIFNPGAAVDVRLAAVFGGNYGTIPMCENGGSTAEYNNLVLVDGSCKTWSYPNPAGVGSPYIQFSEESDDNPNVWPELRFSDPFVPGFDKLQWTIQVQRIEPNKPWRWVQQNLSNQNGIVKLEVQPGGQGSNGNNGSAGTVEFTLGGDPFAIFSGNSPSCKSNNDLGVTCSISYPWVLGRAYTLTIASTGQGPTQPVWTGTLTDNLTGISTTIGVISVSGVNTNGWTLIPPDSTVYAYPDPSQFPSPHFNECSELPPMDVIINTPVRYYQSESPVRMTEDSFVGNCTLYTPIAQSQYEIQIGSAEPTQTGKAKRSEKRP